MMASTLHLARRARRPRETTRDDMQRKIGLDPERIRALIDKPHDALFRALISDPARADALIREHFPTPLRHLLGDTRARPGFVG